MQKVYLLEKRLPFSLGSILPEGFEHIWTRSQTTRKAGLVVCPWTVLVVTLLTMIEIHNVLSLKIYLLHLAGRMTHPRCGLISRGATFMRNRPEAPGLGLLRIRLITPVQGLSHRGPSEPETHQVKERKSPNPRTSAHYPPILLDVSDRRIRVSSASRLFLGRTRKGELGFGGVDKTGKVYRRIQKPVSRKSAISHHEIIHDRILANMKKG